MQDMPRCAAEDALGGERRVLGERDRDRQDAPQGNVFEHRRAKDETRKARMQDAEFLKDS